MAEESINPSWERGQDAQRKDKENKQYVYYGERVKLEEC
jgi:hypothetical protein